MIDRPAETAKNTTSAAACRPTYSTHKDLNQLSCANAAMDTCTVICTIHHPPKTPLLASVKSEECASAKKTPSAEFAGQQQNHNANAGRLLTYGISALH